MSVRSVLTGLVPSTWHGELRVSLAWTDDPDDLSVVAGLRASHPRDEIYTANHVDARTLYALSRNGGSGAAFDLLGRAAEDSVRHTLRLSMLRRYLTADLGFALFAADNDTDPEYPFPVDTMRQMWRLENTQLAYAKRAGSVLWWAERGDR